MREVSHRMFAESKLLFKLWLKNPRKIGAVAVSSPELAASMARQIPGGDGYVVELGGGTGRVTRAILESGTSPDRLVVLERDPTLHRVLSERYPQVKNVLGDALHLQALLKERDIHPVKAVVSSLPLLSMKKAVQYGIGAQAFAVLEPGAPFIQFTYGLFSPLPHRELGVQGRVKDRAVNSTPKFAINPPITTWVMPRRRSCRSSSVP